MSTPVVDETTTEPDERGTPVLLRNVIGDVLREVRQRQGRTLREVSSDAKVSLGYLSEVERGQKEASSELLASISEALNTPLSHIMRVVSGRLAAHEPVRVPDTVPDEFLDELAPAAP
ncbi:helix-turn-helix domain-containing protein [Georgenia sp. Z1344]